MFFLLKTLVYIDVLMVSGLCLFRWALAPQYRAVVSTKVVVLALLTPVVALFCGNIYIFCGYLVLAVAFNARSRSELAASYVFLLPLMPFLKVETGVGSIYLLAVSAVTAMNLGAFIAFFVGSGRKSLAQPRYDIAVLLLIGIFTFVSGRGASATGILRELVVNVLGFGAPYLLVSRGVASQKDADLVLLRLALGGTVTAITACFQAVKHWVLFETYYQTLHVPIPIASASLAMRAGLLRTGGSMVDYSAAGLFFAAVLTLMMVLRSRFRLIGYRVVMALLIGGLFATQSRGAWVAAIAGFLFVFAYRGLWSRVALLTATSLAAYISVQLFATTGRLADIAGRTAEATGTVSYRKQLFSLGMEQVRAHPLLGQAPDRLIANLPDLVQGQHIVDFVNAHLYVAMVAGVPLFLVWSYIWLSPVVATFRRRRFVEPGLSEAPAFIIVPVLVAIIATAATERNLMWPTIALGLAGPCWALTRRRGTARIAGREPVPDFPLATGAFAH